MAADPGNPYVTRRELDDLLREELAAVRRETNEAIRELRDDLHTFAVAVWDFLAVDELPPDVVELLRRASANAGGDKSANDD